MIFVTYPTLIVRLHQKWRYGDNNKVKMSYRSLDVNSNLCEMKKRLKLNEVQWNKT